jgi:ABC-type polysaccharide/polyol phosphate export permease
MQSSRPDALWRYRDLVRFLVLRDLRLKYKGSSLGFAWSFLHPLLMATVYTVAFQYVLRVDIPRFPAFLLSGLLPWTFFATALSAATGSVADNGPLVRKVSFPRATLPLGAVLGQFVQFLLMYAAVLPLLWLLGVRASAAQLALVPLAALELLFVLGAGWALAAAYVHFRDTRHLLEVGLQIGFWLTPVVYSLSLVPPRFRPWFAWNPMAQFVTAYHTIVLDGRLPGAVTAIVLVLVALASAAGGLAVFVRCERRFAELV